MIPRLIPLTKTGSVGPGPSGSTFDRRSRGPWFKSYTGITWISLKARNEPPRLHSKLGVNGTLRMWYLSKLDIPGCRIMAAYKTGNEIVSKGRLLLNMARYQNWNVNTVRAPQSKHIIIPLNLMKSHVSPNYSLEKILHYHDPLYSRNWTRKTDHLPVFHHNSHSIIHSFLTN